MKTETFDFAKQLQNRRFAEAVSDNDLHPLIESESNCNNIENTKWSVEMFNKQRESLENERRTAELLVTMLTT